ncbi:hypothetical protein BFF78_11355 [Streptomyces fodineus]|uniref:Uncharacterized protein n=1 Tax=Streptomyces fodineus TaxID=1904616 RepID=A0A1D7Y7K5_9ACTN|nr:hypothetical protein [Streptomyces fodineus]AOR31562.1 hypothetical protein BFF78_11355 [Streptomyces fodineus]
MPPRTFAVLGAGIAATVLAVSGITYASTDGSAPASPSVHREARPVHRAARPVQRPAPATAPTGGRGASGERNEGRGGEGHGDGHEGHGEGGRIYFNERSYSASAEGCITATGSSSFSVFNDSRKTVEVFRGFSCDNGAPVATVGPHGDTFGVVTRTGQPGVFGDDGVVGSFLVVCDHDER